MFRVRVRRVCLRRQVSCRCHRRVGIALGAPCSSRRPRSCEFGLSLRRGRRSNTPHSRDITALHVFGVEQALTEDEPAYPAIEAGALIETSATRSATKIRSRRRSTGPRGPSPRGQCGSQGAANWSRGITIGDERSTVRRLLEHELHDSLHHLDDVNRACRPFGHSKTAAHRSGVDFGTRVLTQWLSDPRSPSASSRASAGVSFAPLCRPSQV